MVERTLVFSRLRTLKDLSAVALATGMVNKMHKIEYIDG
jgi:hypothetical protein